MSLGSKSRNLSILVIIFLLASLISLFRPTESPEPEQAEKAPDPNAWRVDCAAESQRHWFWQDGRESIILTDKVYHLRWGGLAYRSYMSTERFAELKPLLREVKLVPTTVDLKETGGGLFYHDHAAEGPTLLRLEDGAPQAQALVRALEAWVPRHEGLGEQGTWLVGTVQKLETVDGERRFVLDGKNLIELSSLGPHFENDHMVFFGTYWPRTNEETFDRFDVQAYALAEVFGGGKNRK